MMARMGEPQEELDSELRELYIFQDVLLMTLRGVPVSPRHSSAIPGWRSSLGTTRSKPRKSHDGNANAPSHKSCALVTRVFEL